MTLAVVVSGLCGLVIPAVVDLLTKSHAAHSLKTAAAVVLSALAGAVSTVQYAPGERWTTYAAAILSAFTLTMAGHATHYSDAIQRRTARFGIHRPRRH